MAKIIGYGQKRGENLVIQQIFHHHKMGDTRIEIERDTGTVRVKRAIIFCARSKSVFTM